MFNLNKGPADIPDQFLHRIFQKMVQRSFSWKDAEEFLKFNPKNNEVWHSFFEKTYQELLLKPDTPQKLKIYVPGHEFPSISITGEECQLNCEHCDKKYLQHMLPAKSAESLEKTLEKLVKRNAIGTLISGGCDEDGKVPIWNYADAIEKFQHSNSNQNFYLNSHVGLVNEKEAEMIAKMKIDTVSFDLNLDPMVIEEVFHLTQTPEDYKSSFLALLKHRVRVIPHVLVGAYFGKIQKELEALQFLAQLSQGASEKLGFPYDPEIIVFIIMIPPHHAGKTDPRFKVIQPEDIAKLILVSRYFFPSTELSLGCMRPHGAYTFNLEKWSIQAGITRIVKPSLKTRKWLHSQPIDIESLSACCIIPKELDSIAQSRQ